MTIIKLYLDGYYYDQQNKIVYNKEQIKIPEWLWISIIFVGDFLAGESRVSKKLFDKYVIIKSHMWFLMTEERKIFKPFNVEKFVDNCCELDTQQTHEFVILYGNMQKYKIHILEGDEFNNVIDKYKILIQQITLFLFKKFII